MNRWWYFTDPVQDKPSVSLTMGIVSSLILITAGILQIAGKTSGIGPFMEMFWGSWALYFGRRLGMNGKNFESSKEEKEEKPNE
jgi:uncharacterized membrane protein (UPF0136 family)